MQAEYTDGLSKGVFSIFLRRIPLLKKSVLYQWSHTHTHSWFDNATLKNVVYTCENASDSCRDTSYNCVAGLSL